MNPGGGGCSELRTHHCTPAWVTERDSISKKKKITRVQRGRKIELIPRRLIKINAELTHVRVNREGY